MKTIYGDLFKLPNVDAICIPTSGYVDDAGYAPMLRGIAKSAVDRWPEAPKILGGLIKENGNVTQVILQASSCDLDKVRAEAASDALLEAYSYAVVSFPVKPKKGKRDADGSNIVPHMRGMFKEGEDVPGWVCKGSLELIEISARWLVILAKEKDWKVVALPKVGCGVGEFRWDEVKPILDKLLDDRFCIVTEEA